MGGRLGSCPVLCGPLTLHPSDQLLSLSLLFRVPGLCSLHHVFYGPTQLKETGLFLSPFYGCENRDPEKNEASYLRPCGHSMPSLGFECRSERLWSLCRLLELLALNCTLTAFLLFSAMFLWGREGGTRSCWSLCCFSFEPSVHQRLWVPKWDQQGFKNEVLGATYFPTKRWAIFA